MALDSYTHIHHRGDAGAPTLIMLHGTGDDAAGFSQLGPMIAPGASVLALDGDVREGPMRRFFRRRGEGKYDMDDLARRTRQLDGFLREAAAQYGFGPETAIAVGYSNGANILANLLLEGGWAAKRTVLMHPLIPYTPECTQPLDGCDVLMTAGQNDPIGPLHLTQHLASLLTARGAGVSLAVSPGGHQLTHAEIATVRQHLASSDAATAAA